MSPSEKYWNYKPAQNLGRWVIGLMATTVLCELLFTTGDVAGMLMFPTWNDPNADITNDTELALVGLVALSALVTLGCFIATVVMFCIWQYRAAANARALGAQGMQVNPGWNAGWWFVPFANLVMPFKAMVENYNASRPDVDPVTWKDLGTPAIIGWWWGIWLIGNGFDQASTRLGLKDAPELVELSIWLGVVGTSLSLIGFLLVTRIIRTINRNQTLLADMASEASIRICPRCNYDLQATTSASCPECGCLLPQPVTV